MDPAALRPLARTGLEVTALGLGTAPLGELFERVSDAESTGVVDAAWDAGVRYVDTSPFYGHGKSEIRVGRAIGDRPRAELVLSTKVGRLFRRPADPSGFRPSGWAGALPFEIRFDYSYDGIMRSVEDSYLRLGTNTIDVLFIHDLDEQFHPDPDVLAEHRRALLGSGWRALEMLKAAGVIGAYGAGINDRASMRWFLDHMEVDVFLLALRYTLLEHDVLDDELPRCAEAGTGLVVGGVFNSGILATGARPGARYNYGEAPPDGARPCPTDRVGVSRVRRAAGGSGAPVPARPPARRERDPRRPVGRARRAERRRVPPPDPRRPVAGAARGGRPARRCPRAHPRDASLIVATAGGGAALTRRRGPARASGGWRATARSTCRGTTA